MRQLSGQDASFLYLDTPNCDMHGTMVFIYDPSTAPKQPVGFKDILRHVESRLSVSRIFRQRLVRVPLDVDFPYWIDDESFDIEYHVRHMALPKPCDWRQFQIVVSRLNAPPLNMQRPPWEMVVIEGLDNLEGLPAGSFALLIKGHHCAMDGHSLAELTMGLHDLSADGSKRVEVTPVPFSPEASPSLLYMLAKAVTNNVTSPLKLVGPVKRALPGMATMMTRFYTRVLTDPGSNPVTRFNGPVSPHRVFGVSNYALDDVKRIRKAVPGATVNDTVLSIAAGAVREYLASKNELPDVSLRVLAPINTRTESEFGQAGNRISMFFPDVHTEIDNPIERLAAVYASTRHAKQVADGIGAREMTDITLHSPAALTMLAAKLFTQAGLSEERTPIFHFGLSNAPGPTVPLYLCGAQLQAWTVLVPLSHGFGLGFAVTSYLDKLTISFTADRKALPDPDYFGGCIDRSCAAHLAAANEVLRRHPELLHQANKPQRRAHPGMASMSKLGKAALETTTLAQKRKPKPARKPAQKMKQGAEPAPTAVVTARATTRKAGGITRKTTRTK